MYMPPEELKQQIARVKEKEHAEAEKMHDIMLSDKRKENLISKIRDTQQQKTDKKKIVTLVAVVVLLVLGFIYAKKQNFWMNSAQREQDKKIQQALDRMEEVQKANPPVTPADVTSVNDFMTNFRSQEKAYQIKKK